MFDGKAFGEEVVGFVRSFVESELAPLKAENESLKQRLAELEAREPVPGPPGEKGERGDPGEKGADGRDGIDGKDAANFVETLKHDGELVVTLEDGRLLRTGIRDGAPGKDGRDGFGLSDFDVNAGADGRTIQWSFEQGEQRFEVDMKHPLPIYRHIFKQGTEYEPGDLVTYGGSLGHCDEKTTEKPDAGPWTCAVKKGRDGKDAKPNG